MKLTAQQNIFFAVLAGVVLLGAFALRSQGKGAMNAPVPAVHKDVYYCPMHPTYTSDRPGTCPICNMNLVKREETPVPSSGKSEKIQAELGKICLLHNCHKMHEGKSCPMMVLANPGETVTCPICGTHVVPDVADMPASMSPEGYAPILLSPQKRQVIGLKTAPAEKKPLTKSIRAVGTIAHDPELYQAETEYLGAIAAFERAKTSAIPEIIEQSKRLLESTRIKLKHMGLSDEMIVEISAWKEAQHGLLFAHPGDPVWMYAQVYEYELPLIKTGQRVAVDVPSLPGENFSGTVKALDALVDPVTRTTRLRVLLDDPLGHLRPDQFVNATIAVDLGVSIAVPEEAVFDTGTQKIVFIDKGEGLLEPREIVVGAKADGTYQVKSGIEPGELVVTNGNFLIDSESRLKAVLQGMGSSGGHQHGQ